jgi:hypothetical protein
LAPASLGSALGMVRAKSIGALQFGQDGASNWSSVGWLMVVLPPFIWRERTPTSPVIYRSRVHSPTGERLSAGCERITAPQLPTEMRLSTEIAGCTPFRVCAAATNPSQPVNTIAIDVV